ncbi:GNAT family N-acetyltransferase [Olivibacter jilunii]|uniref:GNAT family N-acetyltransferase n=1 Tax=Olivibacter jilunii TaxID=985016 RepID=UPI001F5F1E65|nr:GNAT family N-acetyltransferase [Olivibacter jilunii]
MASLEGIMIRKGCVSETTEMQRLFVDTIKRTCRTDYNEEQINAWVSGIENRLRWQKILEDQVVLVADYYGQIIGFCTLDKTGYIDLLYVQKDFQRIGVASKLYIEIEKEAISKGHTELISNVSLTARCFFERNGFRLIKKQIANINEIQLLYYRMSKSIK